MKNKVKPGQKLYVVSRVSFSAEIEPVPISGFLIPSRTIELSWIEGQVGACAVFTNKKKAKKYAGKAAVYEVRVAKEQLP